MGHNQGSVHNQILRILATGPHTMKGIAKAGELSTRTVQKRLLGLMQENRVTKIDLGSSRNLIEKTYPKGADRVFYQLNLHQPEKIPNFPWSYVVRSRGRYSAEMPVYRRGLNPLADVCLEKGRMDRYT